MGQSDTLGVLGFGFGHMLDHMLKTVKNRHEESSLESLYHMEFCLQRTGYFIGGGWVEEVREREKVRNKNKTN